MYSHSRRYHSPSQFLTWQLPVDIKLSVLQSSLAIACQPDEASGQPIPDTAWLPRPSEPGPKALAGSCPHACLERKYDRVVDCACSVLRNCMYNYLRVCTWTLYLPAGEGQKQEENVLKRGK
jgi:hypothetical protein